MSKHFVLPVDEILGQVVATLREESNLVVEAPPGAGKTTRIPRALFEAGLKDVLVLEPRRLAARLAAKRVAEELGEAVGETVGYQVRFEERAGPMTRIRFVTEGVLTRRMLHDGQLRGVQVVVLDEFHERHLDGDLALALLLRLQRSTRRDLKLVVMSATLEAAPIAQHLGGCKVVRSEGKLFPMQVRYTPDTGQPLEDRVAGAVLQLCRDGLTGDVLAFLPGAAEIRRAEKALQVAREQYGLSVLALHGDMSPEEQDRTLQPSPSRKVILSTNVAESSITIPGVTVVIDSGLARVAVDSPWTGMSSFEIARVSQASANQRAGRSARTAPGTVVRLFPQEEFVRRPKQDTPEVLRRELASTLLQVHGLGVRRMEELPWLTPPPPEQAMAAERLLEQLGAVESGELSSVGREMTNLPLHPRLARLVLTAKARGAGYLGCRAAAVLAGGERLMGKPRHHGDSDLFLLLEQNWAPHTTKALGQISRAARVEPRDRGSDEDLLYAITAAFSDRLGRKRPNGEILLAAGGAATLAESSAVRDVKLLVAVDIEQRGKPTIRLASRVEADWLLDLFPDRMAMRDGVEWNREAERVEQVSSVLFDGLVIEESRSGKIPEEAAAQLLSAKAVEYGLERFAGKDEVAELLARWQFAAEQGGPPAPTSQRLEELLVQTCYGLKSFVELGKLLTDGGLERALQLGLESGQLQQLQRLAPERITLPGGRTTRVHYVAGQAPWIGSRLQDFFGMQETPRVGAGKVPVVVHLLAPNQRPVQVTQDLAGFWTRHYPEIRRELSRRYPRHKWPEDPRALFKAD